MRKLWTIAAIVALGSLASASLVQADGLARVGSGCACQQNYCDACDPCGGQSRGHRHKHGDYEGRSAHFNCGCNGSYKFPVPPLSTYHWPGMWSHQLMTDYHSPWRFPPLKPYVDEPAPVEMGVEGVSLFEVHRASAQSHTAGPISADPTAFSSHLLNMER